jgi:hypothetical protein
MLTYRGCWRITVVGKLSDWPQRIVITGSVRGVIDGRVGTSVVVAGDRWRLAIEHNDGSGWRANQSVDRRPAQRGPDRVIEMVRTKDRYWKGDADPNDLTLRMENFGGDINVGGDIEVVGQYAVDASLRPLADGALAGENARYLAVDIRNSGHRAFGYDAVLDISDTGRDALAEYGVLAQETWSSAALRATGQEVDGRGVALPPLEVGACATVYFPVDAAASRAGAPGVEFFLRRAGEDARRPVTARRATTHPVTIGDGPTAGGPVAPLDLEAVRGMEMFRARAAPATAPGAGPTRRLDVAADSAAPGTRRAPSTGAGATPAARPGRERR